MATDKFWSLAKDNASLVVDAADVEKILGAIKSNKGLFEVKAELIKVTSTSELGLKMFSDSVAVMYESDFSYFIDLGLAELFAKKAITAVEVQSFKDTCYQKLREYPVAVRPGAGEEKVMYRNIACLVHVSTNAERIDTKLASCLKEYALCAGALDALWFEGPILGEPAPKSHCPVIAPDLLAGFQVARGMANDAETHIQPGTGELATAMLQGRMSVLVQADPTFSLEMALTLALSHEPGTKRLHDLVLQELPTDAREKTLPKSRAAIEELLTTKLFLFTSRGVQGTLEAVVGALKQMERGFAPKISSWTSQPFLMKVKDNFQYFMSFPLCAGKGDGKKVFGAEALSMKLKSLHSLHAEGKDFAIEETSCFSAFDWLLSAAAKKEAADLVKDALSKAGCLEDVLEVQAGTRKGQKRCSEGSSSASGAKAAKSSSGPAVSADVLSLFN